MTRIFYPSGKEELETIIKELGDELHKKQHELKELLSDSRVECKFCEAVHKISNLEGIAHMYYVDNVYSGYYALNEYSFICPNCSKNVREYDVPELKKLRPYYGKRREIRKD